ncbi:MAG: ORF6N domain-containing protein [Flavobacteriales bacterium]|nr:ORF6N domain-containing protein [Flavobacteriales bacterium]
MEIQNYKFLIVNLRNTKVLLDFHLSNLYEVETRVLNQAVKRNLERFPEDFMFQLSQEEVQHLISQNVISTKQHGGRRRAPYAFTEQGVAMLSSVLRSTKAIKVNISIMRTFVAMRKQGINYDALLDKIKNLEDTTDSRFEDVFQALDYLISEKIKTDKQKNRKRIGFDID